MKKHIRMIAAALLVIAMVLSLAACGQSKAAKAADELISAIGEVDLGSEEAIAAAERVVDALEQKERDSLKNLDVLKKAREAFDEAVDLDKINAVEELIGAIGNVTTESKDAIDAARKAFDKLEDRLKDRIANSDVLAKAEEDLKKAELDLYAAKAADLKENMDKISGLVDDFDMAEADALIDETLSAARELAKAPVGEELEEVYGELGITSVSDAISSLEETKETIKEMCYTDCYVVRFENVIGYPTESVESGEDFFSYAFVAENYQLYYLSKYVSYLDEHFDRVSKDGDVYEYNIGNGQTLRAKAFTLESFGFYSVFVTPPVMTEEEKNIVRVN